MCVQALLPELSVEGFHDRVVRGFASSIEVDLHLAGVGPQIHLATRELRSGITGKPPRQSAFELQLLHHANNMLGPHTEADFDRQTLPGV
jgi:hypothetical protein